MWIGSFINGMGKLNKQTGLCDYQYKLVDKNNNYIQRVYDFAEDKTSVFGLRQWDSVCSTMTENERIYIHTISDISNQRMDRLSALFR